ncbi:MAG: hypothetical protein QM759_10780 [Terricaulis sp.]
MKLLSSLLVIGAAFFALTGFGLTPERVAYTLTPLIENGRLKAVQVDLIFRGEYGGHTVLELPSEWGGQKELYHSIHDLRAISNVTISDGEDEAHRVLSYRPRALVHVQYIVFQDWVGEPRAENGNPYRPIVQPGYFQFIGSTFLATPRLAERTPVDVHIRNLPSGWRWASDLEHEDLALGNVAASTTVGGDYRVLHGRDFHIRVAIRGQWSFTDAEFAEGVTDIITAERAFWGDAPSPYLVTVTQLTSPNNSWLSIGGTGLGDAFAFFASPNASYAQIARTLAHEAIHTWIPGEVGGMPEGDAEAADYWFSEGFTDFYAGRLMVRGDLWTPAQFAADLNQMLTEYASSPVRTQPNSRVVADFWNDEQVSKLPYQRGRLLATIWDARLRATAAQRDMNWVMQEMRRRARARTHRNAAPLFQTVMRERGADIAADVDQFVTHGAPILLDENIFAPCGRVTTREVPDFSRGFNITATTANNNVISGVDPTSPAYAAGLRNGMVLIRRDAGSIGDSQHELAYVVRDGQTERTIRYMPHGHGHITLQQLVLDDELVGNKLAQCKRTISGG